MSDVAKEVGVTVTAVSAVLRGSGNGTGNVRVSPDTARRIRRIASRLGYRPNMAARLLKGQRNNVLGVLIGAESTPANYERLSALEQEAFRRGLRLMIGQFRGDSERTAQYIEDFLGRGIEGVMCFENPTPSYDEHVLRSLRRFRGVVFQTRRLFPGALCVDVDRAAGVRAAVAHLLARGRRRIGLLLNDRPENDPLMADRLAGYEEGLVQAGREYEGRQVWMGPGVYPPPPELAAEAVGALAEQAGVDAIVCCNDVWAIHLIKAMRRLGKSVPEDLAVIGFDNINAAELFDPGLTTIDQNNAAFAAAAMDLLVAACEGVAIPVSRRTRIVPPRLIVREST